MSLNFFLYHHFIAFGSHRRYHRYNTPVPAALLLKSVCTQTDLRMSISGLSLSTSGPQVCMSNPFHLKCCCFAPRSRSLLDCILDYASLETPDLVFPHWRRAVATLICNLEEKLYMCKHVLFTNVVFSTLSRV